MRFPGLFHSLLAAVLTLTACNPADEPISQGQASGNTQAPVQEPVEPVAQTPTSSISNSPQFLWVGEAKIDFAELEILIKDFSQTYNAFGHDTLGWHLLQGGIGPAAVLHEMLAPASADAKTNADAAALRLQAGEDFYAVYQDLGGDPKPSSQRQPTPYGVGARVAALAGSREAGEWFGPVATMEGWEIVLLEERNDALRSRAGIRLRTILFPIATDPERRVARENWATLPLRATPAVLRTLPASFRWGRTTPLSQ